MKNSVEMIKTEEKNNKNIIEEEKNMEKVEEKAENNVIINDVTPETRAKLNKTKKKEEKMEKKAEKEVKKEKVKKNKPKTKEGAVMDRAGIEKIVKEMAASAKLVCSQGVGRVNSNKPAPVQVRNSAGEVIVAVRAGELLFHLPYEEVVKVGRGHGGGWPHCTKIFYGSVGEADVRKAIGNAFKEKNTVKYWKEIYGSAGRTSVKKELDPKAELKALRERAAILEKEIKEGKKAKTSVKSKAVAKSKKKGGDKTVSAAIIKVAEVVA